MPSITLTQRQARLGVILCMFIIVTVYVFELAEVNINRRGEIAEITGRLTHCSDSRVPASRDNVFKHPAYLFLDTSGTRAYSYTQPETFSERVATACRSNATVRLFYRPYQPLLKDWTGYSVLGLVDITTGEPYFSLADYQSWKTINRYYAIVVLVVTGLALIYLLLVWQGVLGQRDVNKVKNQIRLSQPDAAHLLIATRERNGDSWAFLLLFLALTGWVIWEVVNGSHFAWLLAAAVTLLVAYGYLVEVVNTHYFSLDADHLVCYSAPLPWFSKPVVIDVNEIVSFLGEEEMLDSFQGGAISYPVAVQLYQEGEPVLLFYTRDLAEALAVAELGNAHLSRIR